MIHLGWAGFVWALFLPWLSQGRAPLQALPQEVRQLTRHEANDHHPVFSPSGDEVLFTSLRGDTAELLRIPIEGGSPIRVPLGLSGDLYSDWHPDGRSIVFDARGAGGPPDVYRYWLESAELQQLTDHPGMDGQPSFSPDGRQIVFMSMRGGSRDVWIMDSDGRNQRRLTDHPAGEWHPRWSPDGRHVLFTSDREGDVDIWVVGVDGTGLRKLTTGPGVEDRGAWSPDGSRVAFQWEGDLWVVDSRGGDPERLTDFPGSEGNAAWSPDGRAIVFASDRSGAFNLWLLSLGRTGSTPGGSPAEHLTIDHLILGTTDLAWGIGEFARRTGVEPQRGGRHPTGGTQNALVSVGAQTYLEILAPDVARDSVSEASDASTPPSLAAVGWAVSSTDVEATAERLRANGYRVSESTAGSRILPDGDVLRWKTLGLMEPVARFTPFFIQWDAASPHPAATSPPGCTLESVDITEPGGEALTKLLSVLGVDVQVRPGPSAEMRLTLACPTGRVVFGR